MYFSVRQGFDEILDGSILFVCDRGNFGYNEKRHGLEDTL